MGEFADIWIEQCDATREIREALGTKKALGYLIGEKLLNHIRASDSDPSWAATLPLFATEIKRIVQCGGATGNTSTTVGSTCYLLFDPRTDPGERHDVAQQHADLVRELRSLVAKWEADVDAESKERTTPAR